MRKQIQIWAHINVCVCACGLFFLHAMVARSFSGISGYVCCGHAVSVMVTKVNIPTQVVC